jgi:hypothetical protein
MRNLTRLVLSQFEGKTLKSDWLKHARIFTFFLPCFRRFPAEGIYFLRLWEGLKDKLTIILCFHLMAQSERRFHPFLSLGLLQTHLVSGRGKCL